MTASTVPTPIEDPENEVEPLDYALRQHLGLTPFVHYDNNDHAHPDTRPCPAWCWVGNADGYEHEINRWAPLTATHALGGFIHIGARHYIADKDGDRIRLATIEPWIEQEGAADPVIGIALRHRGKRGQHKYSHDRLKMHPDEARELVRALEFLIGLSEGQ